MLKFLTVSSLLLALALGAESSESGSSESGSSESGSSESGSSESGSSESGSSESGSSESGSESSGEGISTTRGSSSKSNYYLGNWLSVSDITSTNSTVYFPYAVDQCSSGGLLSSDYIKPVCVGTSRINIEHYSDADCTTSTITESYNSTRGSFFHCGGTSSYALLKFGFSSCTSSYYAALDACALTTTDVYSSISCSDDTASLNYYFLDPTCGTPLLSASISSTCSNLNSTIGDLYGSIEYCSDVTATTTTASVATTSTSSSSTSSSDTTTTSSTGTTLAPSSDANMIAFRNILGIFIMVIGIMMLNF